MHDRAALAEGMRRGERLRWLNTIYAGVDDLPLDVLRTRGVIFTSGAGINAITIAEYVVMGVLTVAKGFREVVRAQERRQWLRDAPGKVELAGSRALLLGAGAIGARLEPMLAGFAVAVTKVRRTPAPNALGPEEWRGRHGHAVADRVDRLAEKRQLAGTDRAGARVPQQRLIAERPPPR